MEFCKGQYVEVQGNSKNTDSWYGATVIHALPPNKLVVEYDMLKNEKAPLKEIVNVNVVRPRPRFRAQVAFQLHQIVDVYMKYGWWKGEVIDVLKGLKYMVLLDSPSVNNREIIEHFGDLRVHQDWVSGNWVIPTPQQQMHTDSMYNQCDKKKIDQAQMSQAVSISSTAIANKSNQRKLRTETTNLIRNTRFLLLFNRSKNRKTPGYRHTLQTKACKMTKNRKAPVYKHTLRTTGKLHRTYLCTSTPPTKDEEAPPQNKENYLEDVVDNFSTEPRELRDHLPLHISHESNNWQKAGTFSSPLEESSHHPQPDVPQHTCTMRNQDYIKRSDHSHTQFGCTKGRHSNLESDSKETEHASKRKAGSDPNSYDRYILDYDFSYSDPKAVEFSMLPQNNPEESEHYDSSNTSVQFSSKLMDFQSEGHSMKSFCDGEIQQPREGAGEQTSTIPDRAGSELNEICSNPSEGVSPDNQLTFQSKMIVTSIRASFKSHEVQEPCTLAKCCRTSEELTNTKDHCYEAVEEAEYEDSLRDHGKDVKISEDENVVFTKSYSMEELCLLPQQPHFRILGDIYELLREGEHENKQMISFINLAKKTSTLQPDEPKSALEMMLQAVNTLKPFKIHVGPLQTRLEKLLQLKERQHQVHGMLEEYQRQITKEKVEESLKARSSMLEERVLEIQASIAKMKEKQQMVEMEKVTTCTSIAV